MSQISAWIFKVSQFHEADIDKISTFHEIVSNLTYSEKHVSLLDCHSLQPRIVTSSVKQAVVTSSVKQAVVTSSVKQAALTKQWVSPTTTTTTTTQTSLQTMKEKIVSIANHDSMYNFFSLRFCKFIDAFILII